jgi:hypothetical protein
LIRKRIEFAADLLRGSDFGMTFVHGATIGRLPSSFKRRNAVRQSQVAGAGVSDSKPVQFAFQQQKSKKGSSAMARVDLGYLPHKNPCAQCGQPIAAPDWVEAGPRRMSYLWYCRACDYRFEAVAFFNDSEPDREALAA